MPHERVTHSRSTPWLHCWVQLCQAALSSFKLSRPFTMQTYPNFPAQFPTLSPSHAQLGLQSSHDPSQLRSFCSSVLHLRPPLVLYPRPNSLFRSSSQAPVFLEACSHPLISPKLLMPLTHICSIKGFSSGSLRRLSPLPAPGSLWFGCIVLEPS